MMVFLPATVESKPVSRCDGNEALTINIRSFISLNHLSCIVSAEGLQNGVALGTRRQIDYIIIALS